jgi:hypothetical protein
MLNRVTHFAVPCPGGGIVDPCGIVRPGFFAGQAHLRNQPQHVIARELHLGEFGADDPENNLGEALRCEIVRF